MDKIEELLTRGVDKIYPSRDELEEVLRSGKKLKLYQGFDPTATQLHIGHMVGLIKLSQWQKLGHHVIFLIGDGTGQAGDPSGKTKAREKFFTRDELRANATDYVKQANKIVDFDGENPVEILFNGDWLNDLKLADILEIARHFSWQQLAERDLFQERIKKGETLSLREALYPLLQAYDSVAMDVDLELGGSDQTFNMLCGRTLMKSMKNKNKFVMTTPLLADSSGNKIGKTEGNAIALTDKPADLFGKIMSFSDEVIIKCFESLTKVPTEEVINIKVSIERGDNPMPYKKRLAFEVVKELNDESAARRAQEEFEKVFQDKKTPTFVTELLVKAGEIDILKNIVGAKLAASQSDTKRLLTQGAIEVNGRVISEPVVNIESRQMLLVKIGKHRFLRIAAK